MTIISAAILLFMVMDPFGNIPLFVSALNNVPESRRMRIVRRELLIALGILAAFLFAGPGFLRMLQISQPSLRVAGGVVLFLIAIKMIFGDSEQMFRGTPEGEPFIVPLAVPYVAGPSATATVLMLVGQEPGKWTQWLIALCLAWAGSAIILLFSPRLSAFFGKRGLCAIERLTGLVLTAVSVEMLMRGISEAF